MNILIDELPKTIMIGGVEYDINSDFRTSVLYELLLLDDEVSPEDKLEGALRLFYPVMPLNVNEAIEGILWFYECGKEKPESKGGGSGTPRIYSYDFDDSYIYSAFLSQYNLDLQDLDYLHWWKFKAMFQSLNEDCEIRKIMGYRAITITNDMSKEHKAFYTNMKNLYKIPLSKNETEKLSAIEGALINGGDLTGLL